MSRITGEKRQISSGTILKNLLVKLDHHNNFLISALKRLYGRQTDASVPLR